MKISKLFHWLYAIVMLLPVFAIGVTCGYAMFNKNAYQSYYGDTINEETQTFVDVDNLELNKNYLHKQQQYTTTEVGPNCYLYFEDLQIVTGNPSPNGNPDYPIEDCTQMLIYMNTANKITLEFYKDNLRTSYYSYPVLTTGGDFRYIEFSFTYLGKSNDSTNWDYFNNNYELSYNQNSFISEVFYYSVDRVTESPLFSWAYNSFLVAPFSYIVALFGMPTNHLVVQLLSYWLAISIIWLVFDLVMYVPLLVHRWLDKGVLE